MLGRPDSTLLYGDTGVGKTVQLGEIAQWHYEQTGEISRLISADSSWDPIEHLIVSPDNPDGIIEAWNIQHLGQKNDPFAITTMLADGYWPLHTAQGLRMEAPKRNAQNRFLSHARVVGNYLIEGLSTISDMLMQDHIAKNRKLSQDVVGGWNTTVDTMDASGKAQSVSVAMGKAAPSHYGQVQDHMLLCLVPRFAALPVANVIWTSHEGKGTDEITGQQNSVLGPATAGKAATGKTARKFGDTFHLTKVVTAIPANPAARPPIPASLTVERRAYYEDHPDDFLTKLYWPAKLSFPLNKVPELHKAFPQSFIPLTLTTGMVEYFKFKKAAQAPRPLTQTPTEG